MVSPVRGVELAQEADHHVDLRRAEARHDLVEQQQLGFGRESARHFELLAVGQGEALRDLIAPVVRGRAGSECRAAAARASARRGRRCRAPTVTFSSTLSPLKGFTIWKVRPTPASHTRSGRRPEICCAVQAHLRRRSARCTPAIMLKIVVLPAPLGPISAWIAPAGTAKQTSCTRAGPGRSCPVPSSLEARAAHSPLPKPRRSASHGHTPAGRYITMTSRARP